jgi:hypothetical protein
MVKIHPLPAADAAAPMARAKKLAERMAKRLENEEVGDVTIAVALLMSGVVLHYADDRAKAHDLTAGIRRLEDRFIERALQASTETEAVEPRLQASVSDRVPL